MTALGVIALIASIPVAIALNPRRSMFPKRKGDRRIFDDKKRR